MDVSDLYVSLTYDDAAAAIEWLCRAFGFTKQLVVPGPDNSIQHSELSLGNAVVMVSSPKPEMNRVSQRHQDGASHGLCLFTDDPDSHFARAKTAGAKIVRELTDEEYGCRGYLAEDLEGHVWYFSDYRPGAYWDKATSSSPDTMSGDREA